MVVLNPLSNRYIILCSPEHTAYACCESCAQWSLRASAWLYICRVWKGAPWNCFSPPACLWSRLTKKWSHLSKDMCQREYLISDFSGSWMSVWKECITHPKEPAPRKRILSAFKSAVPSCHSVSLPLFILELANPWVPTCSDCNSGTVSTPYQWLRIFYWAEETRGGRRCKPRKHICLLPQLWGQTPFTSLLPPSQMS